MLLRDEQAALDAMQEVFIRALRAGSEFRSDASPMTWLYRITTNYCLNAIRDNARRGELLRAHAVPVEEKPLSAEEEAAIRQPILDKYEREGSPYYSTARLWDDGILDPAATREALALGISAAFNAPIPPPKFGVFRM